MKKLIAATLLASAFAYPAFAQEIPANADPACIMTNSDGTKKLDTVKCKDGMPIAASGTVDPAAPAANETTAATPPAATTAVPTIVTSDAIAGAKIMSAADFVDKTVYAPDGASVGEVNDFFVTQDGKVQAVVIGVGGFLGIGEKDVAVSMPAIQMQPDGDNTKLVINATKEELTAAPTYDRVKRVYVQ